MNIPKSIITKLNKIASKTDWDVKTLQELLLRHYKEVSKVESNKKLAWLTAYRRFYNEICRLEGTLRSQAIPYYIYVFGEEPVVDLVEIRKSYVERIGYDRALEEGMIDNQGNILDWRPWRKGKVIDKPMFRKRYYALLSRDNKFSEVNSVIIEAYDEQANKLRLGLNRFYKVRLNKSNNPLIFRVSRASIFRNVPINELDIESVTEILNNLTIYDLDNLDLCPRNEYVYVKGFIGRIFPKRGRAYILELNDLEGSRVVLRCLVPNILDIYDTNNEMILYGVLRERDSDLLFNVSGYIIGEELEL